MLVRHNQYHLRYLRDHTVNKVHNMELIPMIDRMMIMKASRLEWPNRFPRVIKQWSIFQHAISQSSHNTWLASTVINNSMKVSKSLNKTEVCFTKMAVNNNWSKCWTTYSSLTLIPWMASSTSAQPTWLYKTCNAEHTDANLFPYW